MLPGSSYSGYLLTDCLRGLTPSLPSQHQPPLPSSSSSRDSTRNQDNELENSQPRANLTGHPEPKSSNCSLRLQSRWPLRSTTKLLLPLPELRHTRAFCAVKSFSPPLPRTYPQAAVHMQPSLLVHRSMELSCVSCSLRALPATSGGCTECIAALLTCNQGACWLLQHHNPQHRSLTAGPDHAQHQTRANPRE